MRYDFITNEILQNYKFFEIQFDDDEQKVYIHGDHSISIPTLGTQFGNKIGGCDLFIDSKPTPTIDVSSFGDHFTLIFKYNLINYNGRLFLGYFLGFTLYVYNKKDGYYGFGNGGTWWAYTNGFGNKYNTNYELAIEVKPGQLKIWLNGKLVSKTSHPTMYRVKPYIYFGPDPEASYYSPQFYLNDVFCINKSEFLPDQYTVNWREPWYELMCKHIYTHHNEAFILNKISLYARHRGKYFA